MEMKKSNMNTGCTKEELEQSLEAIDIQLIQIDQLLIESIDQRQSPLKKFI